jgi:hypothetical protein
VALFGGPDPKDEIIAVLRDERDYLRRKVEEMEKQFLAMTSTHAFRLVHPEERGNETPAIPPVEDAFTKKTSDHRPTFSLKDVEVLVAGPRDPFMQS